MFASLLRSRLLNRAVGVAAAVTSVSVLNCGTIQSSSVCDSSAESGSAEWVSGYSPEGLFYFYNVKTGESTWTNPVANVGSREDNQWYENWDLRAPKPKAKPATEASSESEGAGEKKNKETQRKKRVNHQLILVRHGEYQAGSADHERVLTERGRKQARATGRRLQELVAARTVYPVKYIYFSTMARATETHRLMQEQMPAVEVAPHNISPCSMIREGAVCPPSPPHSSWKPSEEDFKKDGMRVEAAFAAHVARADPEEEESSYSTVLVCHGNVIRYFAMKALQLPVNAWLRTTVANCSISTLVVHSDGHVSLRGLGDCGHLSTEDVTY